MALQKQILSKSENVEHKYTIQFFIKKGSHAESYRVKDQNGITFFLKVFELSKLHRTQFDNEGDIKEVNFLKSINHPNIVSFHDSGEFVKGNKRYAYLVLNYISGETLEERIKRDRVLTAYEVKQIISSVLNGLKYLHNQVKPLVHNDINHQNIMLDLNGASSVAKIIDFGYARYFHNSTKVFYREGLNPYYLAPECFNNIFSPQSDLYSVGALIYQLMTGLPPWFVDISDYQKEQTVIEEVLLLARKKPLKVPHLLKEIASNAESDLLLKIAKIALEADSDKRFRSADEMLAALNGEIDIKKAFSPLESSSIKKATLIASAKNALGFKSIAGMEELKETLYQDVIRALEEKELYEEFGLTIPNGMLLYGPPGCGKSFFAQKLSEEAGYNYIEIKSSDLASIYVHGSQQKIGELFEEARKNAPTILNFDEFDALVPNRDSHAGKNQSGEVNEFLSQLNNCGKSGVFVIASTNQPGLIDPAVLRAGRIDKIFFVPPPDEKSRRQMFKMLLEKRPTDLGIDYDQLSQKTENYVSVDISHLVNEAARKAIKERSKITEAILLEVIANTRPSVKVEEIKKYDLIRQGFEGINLNDNRPKIGFRIDN